MHRRVYPDPLSSSPFHEAQRTLRNYDSVEGVTSRIGRQGGEHPMLRQLIIAAVLVASAATLADSASADQRAYGQAWGGSASTRDWNRFYHYPYVYYPQNFWSQDYYKSADSLYHRYPPEMRIPVYNKRWHNYYPSSRRYHKGHHFMLDVF